MRNKISSVLIPLGMRLGGLFVEFKTIFYGESITKSKPPFVHGPEKGKKIIFKHRSKPFKSKKSKSNKIDPVL